MPKLNRKAYAHAVKLIGQGKVDRSSRWSFAASDSDMMLGDQQDWKAYASWFLAIDEDDPKTKDACHYPFGKNGKVFRSALVAIRQRASRQNETEVFDAAGKLISQIDAMTERAAREAMGAAGDIQAERANFRADSFDLFQARQADESGLVWEAVLIAPGLSRSEPPWYFSEEVLKAAAAAHVFDGVSINAYDARPELYVHLPIPNLSPLEDVKRYLICNQAGVIETSCWKDGVGIVGRIRFNADHKWIPERIRQGRSQGDRDPLGLSIDSVARGIRLPLGETPVLWATEITSASSVDVVTYPAAGGRFLRAVAALTGQEKRMDKDKIIALIKAKRPELLNGKDTAALGEDEILELARQAMEAPVDGKGGKPEEPAGEPERSAQAKPLTAEEIQKLIVDGVAAAVSQSSSQAETRVACARMVGEKLSLSTLPEIARARVRGSLADKVVSEAEIDGAIKAEQEYVAQMASFESQFSFPSQIRASGGLGQREKVEIAVDRLFGLTAEDRTRMASLRRLDGRPFFGDMRAAQAADYEAAPVPTGIRELYFLLTGDGEVTGRFDRAKLSVELRSAQDITSGTFSFILGNTLGRRLVKDYLATDFGESLLISIRKPVQDFRQQEAVLVGYFGDLDTVDPEAADYQEIVAVTDEESTYSIAQKGNILTITRKLIINDDISLIQRLVSRLGRAARRTHAKYVWAKYSANANCSDGTAWFTVGHGNLGAVALSFANAAAAYRMLGKFTEKDSGEPIGLLDDPSVKPTLVYPIDLMGTAETIINDDFYYSGNDLTTKTRNPLKGKINGQQVSLLTDVNDWGLLLPASVVDCVEMGYLNGRQEPEMFLADSPQAEQVFVADKVRYKIRHEYAGAVIDFRSGYKSIVA